MSCRVQCTPGRPSHCDRPLCPAFISRVQLHWGYVVPHHRVEHSHQSLTQTVTVRRSCGRLGVWYVPRLSWLFIALTAAGSIRGGERASQTLRSASLATHSGTHSLARPAVCTPMVPPSKNGTQRRSVASLPWCASSTSSLILHRRRLPRAWRRRSGEGQVRRGSRGLAR